MEDLSEKLFKNFGINKKQREEIAKELKEKYIDFSPR